jgi:hypothetical protein
MFDPAMTSPDCPPEDKSKGYKNGCPYTSFTPYWNYYCASPTSSCHASGDYANQIVLGALDGTSATQGFNFANTDFTKLAGKDRGEFVKKGTAYMHAWMYAIREFEDAIDDCVSGTPTNAQSTGPVHAWDEGVAFFVGSAMETTVKMFSRPDGFLAYTLGNKRCANYKTCGLDGESGDKQQSKQNSDLFVLFAEGQQKLVTGDCGGAVPIKDKIVEAMTVPLVQGALRYAHKMEHDSGATAKEAGEGAIFALAVLPQVHACNATSAATIEKHASMNNFYGAKTYDYSAVKEAFESCYHKLFSTYENPCKEIGGLYSSGAYLTESTPCSTAKLPGASSLPGYVAPVAPGAGGAGGAGGSGGSDGGLSTGGLVGIIIAAVIAAILLILVVYMCRKEKEGKPIFAPVAGTKA